MSSVGRCYTPLKTNIYIKPKDHYDQIRRDSFEIDVFQASSYYSAIREGPIPDANDANCVQEDGQVHDNSMRKHSMINIGRCSEMEEPKKIKNKNKKLQPGSPGAKLASYLQSLLNQTHLVSKPKRNKPRLFEDDKKSSRSSSMSLSRCADVVETTSVHSCPTYTSYRRPTTGSSNIRGVAHGYKNFRSYSSVSSKQGHLLDHEETLEADGRWPALTWFDKELKIRKGVSYSVKGLKKVREEDGGESDSSSDLFELQNHGVRGQGGGGGSGELPVHRTTTTNMKISELVNS